VSDGELEDTQELTITVTEDPGDSEDPDDQVQGAKLTYH